MGFSPADRDVDDPGALAAAARRRFEAGDFGAARAGFERAFAAGDDSAETVAALHALYADGGDEAAVVRLLETYLDRVGAELPAAEVARWEAALFDAAALAEPATERRAEAALRVLEAVATAGGEAWSLVLEPARRGAIEAAFVSPLAVLELLEQESYAPAETGLPAGAVAQAEEIGRRYAAVPEVARAAERLLHGLGEREAACRIEAGRRAGGQARRRKRSLGRRISGGWSWRWRVGTRRCGRWSGRT